MLSSMLKVNLYIRYLFVISLLICCIPDTPCNGQLITSVYGSHLQDRPKEELWSSFEDVLYARKVGFVGDLGELPKGFHRELIKMLTFPTAVSTGANISQECIQDTLIYVENLLLKGSDWAVKMLGTSGQLPVGIGSYGNHHAQGLFDECQAIRSEEPYRFRGKYCTVFAKLAPITQEMETTSSVKDDQESNSPILFILRRLFGSTVVKTVNIEPQLSPANVRATVMNLPSLGVCLPSSCSASDLGQSIAHMIGNYAIGNQSIVTIYDENYCSTEDRALPPLDGPAITVIVVLGLITSLVLFATIQEAWRIYRRVEFVPEKEGLAITVLHCFSAINNSRKLFSTNKKPSDSEDLSCIHGVRFLTASWLVMAHNFLKLSPIGWNFLFNPIGAEQGTLKTFSMRVFLNSTVAVDTFFLISGLVMSFFFLKKLDQTKGKFNVGTIYLMRYLRLTPVYAIVLAVVATLGVYVSNGPNWSFVILATEACRSNWWHHLLYINNMFSGDSNKMCLVDTWYLATDMQLFLIAPFLTYALWRWKKVGPLVLALVMLGSLGTNFAIFAVYNLSPTLIPSVLSPVLFENFISYLEYAYFKTWTRAPTYLVGVFTGWILYRMKNIKSKLSSMTIMLSWAMSIGVCSSVVFGIYPYVHGKPVETGERITNVIYGSLHRTAWALAVAWIIFACTSGYGGLVDRILSWKGFIPLSRLSYCVYLVQFNYINIYYARSRKLIYFTLFDHLTTTLGFLIPVFVLAFVLSVVFESPFLNLINIMSSSPKDKSRNKEESNIVDHEQKKTQPATRMHDTLLKTTDVELKNPNGGHRNSKLK